VPSSHRTLNISKADVQQKKIFKRISITPLRKRRELQVSMSVIAIYEEMEVGGRGSSVLLQLLHIDPP
jgi:hypothetical protein